MTTKPVGSVFDDIRDYLGEQHDPVKSALQDYSGRVYDGIMVCRAVWGQNLEIPASILEECQRRRLTLVTFYKAGESYSGSTGESLILFPEGMTVRNLKGRLGELGFRVHRLARLVATESGPEALLLGLLDRGALRRAPTFVTSAQSQSAAAKFPVLGNNEVNWKETLEHTEAGLLLPVVKSKALAWGPEAVAVLLAGLPLARRINIASTAQPAIWNNVLDSLLALKEQARNNVDRGIELLRRLSPGFNGCTRSPFDDKSGAICFEPHTWRNLVQTAETGSESKQKLLAYFCRKLPDAWSPTHPCYQRILWTPTKVLLRGEAYYVNMRRLSPFKRFELILEEMQLIKGLIDRLQPNLPSIAKDDSEWKLLLALLDQMRNISLQIFSFLHESVQIFSNESALNKTLRGLWGDGGNKAHGFLRASIRAYYSWLLGQVSETSAAATEATRCFSGIADDLQSVTEQVRTKAEERGISQSEKLKDLVRGWREADHPGENLLTAVIAAAKLSTEKLLSAVGIGWGGIELPLVFDYVAGIQAPMQSRQVFIAKYSHYRAEETSPLWSSFPVPGIEPATVSEITVALFDDNTLTGITLEKIRDELLLHNAKEVAMFITRYSGERRLYHMQMQDHGVIDPDLLKQEIDGYLGETPFARSWSAKKKEYKNQIGVFSLARRRILECIYNNSTVELYDREGF